MDPSPRVAHDRLPFPAGVQAHAQALQEGGLHDLCFGLFSGEAVDYPAALERLTQRVLEELRATRGPALLYDAGLGSLLSAARRQGHRMTGVCSDRARHAIAACRCGDDALLGPSTWDALVLEDGAYGAILIHEALRYVDPLVLFGKAYRALDDDGLLILVDEFAVDGFGLAYDGRARLAYLRPLAERCGFVLKAELDLTREAAPTLAYYQRLLVEHRARLSSERQFSEQTLERFEATNRSDRDAYARGRRVYLLLRFQKRTGLRWRVSHVDARDVPAVADLFRRVFKQEMSPDLWEWKYGRGRGQGSIAWAGDRVVAHYGGITRPILYFGRPERACQVADVMVDPEERGILTRKGPFFLTAASLPEACSGFGAKHLIGYGFPNARAMKVAARQGLYAEVGKVVEVYWAPDPARASPLTRVRPLTGAGHSGLDRIAASLWRAMRADLEDAVVGIRDGEWLRYRYLSHPRHHYHLLLVANRVTRTPYGIIVLRKDGKRCELLDIVAPLKRVPRLIREARRLSAQWQSEEVYTWISARYAPLLTGCEGRQRELDVATPTSIWTAAPSPAELQDRWWLMSGDTDFH